MKFVYSNNWLTLTDADPQWLEQKTLSAMCGLVSWACVYQIHEANKETNKNKKERKKYSFLPFSAAVMVSFTGTFYIGTYRLWRRVYRCYAFTLLVLCVCLSSLGWEDNEHRWPYYLALHISIPPSCSDLCGYSYLSWYAGQRSFSHPQGPRCPSHRQAWSTAFGLWSCWCWQAHWCYSIHGAAFWDERFPLHMQLAQLASVLMMHVTAYLHLHISSGILFFQWHLCFLPESLSLCLCGLEIPRCVTLVPWEASVKARQNREETSQPHA